MIMYFLLKDTLKKLHINTHIMYSEHTRCQVATDRLYISITLITNKIHFLFSFFNVFTLQQ